MEVVGIVSMLTICSIFDLWKKQIPICVLCVFGLSGILYQWIYGDNSWVEVLSGVMVGVILYIISIVTKEKVGKGDAFMTMASGAYLGFWENMALLWMASMLAGIICLVVYYGFKKNEEATVPFAPFLLGSYLILYLMGG